ncbi:hypothetical protein ACLOJK_021852 [Asimina triloba]
MTSNLSSSRPFRPTPTSKRTSSSPISHLSPSKDEVASEISPAPVRFFSSVSISSLFSSIFVSSFSSVIHFFFVVSADARSADADAFHLLVRSDQGSVDADASADHLLLPSGQGKKSTLCPLHFVVHKQPLSTPGFFLGFLLDMTEDNNVNVNVNVDDVNVNVNVAVRNPDVEDVDEKNGSGPALEERQRERSEKERKGEQKTAAFSALQLREEQKKMAFLLSKSASLVPFQIHSQPNKIENPLLPPHRQFHIELGAREKAVTANSPSAFFLISCCLTFLITFFFFIIIYFPSFS